MVSLTIKESEVMLKIFKDFSRAYNANSISKEINISSRGCLKILKHLEKEHLVISRKLGKAIFYKINLQDLYARKIIEILLIKEARDKAQRWIDEVKEVFIYIEVAIIFGSIIKNPTHANDIDVLFVYEKKQHKNVSDFITSKNKVLLKKIHDIPQTIKDLKENLKNNPAIIDAIRTGYVLYGQDKITEAIKDVTIL